MKTIEEIDEKLNELRKELASAKGLETEVYSRIVGYYRSVKNWNKGKKQEFGERVLYNTGTDKIEEKLAAGVAPAREAQGAKAEAEKPEPAEVSSYLFFFRAACPNCPPMKRFMAGVALEGRMINVDTEHGLTEASDNNVLSSPTVIFLDESGREAFRSGSPDAIAQYLGIRDAASA